MSAEELKRIFEYNRQSSGILNIDCGLLRGIGKTTCLIQIMVEYKNSFSIQPTIILIVPNSDAISQYRNLNVYEPNNVNSLIYLILTQDEFIQGNFRREIRFYSQGQIIPITNVCFFADEVPNAQYIVNSVINCNFIAGFYSSFENILARHTQQSIVSGFVIDQHTRLRQEVIDKRIENYKIYNQLKENKIYNQLKEKVNTQQNNKMKFIEGT